MRLSRPIITDAQCLVVDFEFGKAFGLLGRDPVRASPPVHEGVCAQSKVELTQQAVGVGLNLLDSLQGARGVPLHAFDLLLGPADLDQAALELPEDALGLPVGVPDDPLGLSVRIPNDSLGLVIAQHDGHDYRQGDRQHRRKSFHHIHYLFTLRSFLAFALREGCLKEKRGSINFRNKTSGPGGIRTRDLQLRRLPPYPG